MSFVNRGGHLSLLSALVLVLVVTLSRSGSVVIAVPQDIGTPTQIRALKPTGADPPTARGAASSGAEIEPRRLSLTQPALSPAVTTVRASLVQVIDSSQFSPPSPDPSGITCIPSTNTLLMSDAEVNETQLYTGVNLFEIAPSGDLIDTASTTASSWFTALSKAPLVLEPTGLAFNADTGHVFITDDQADRIFVMNPGADDAYGTADDIITSLYKTRDFGSHDPEGIAFDRRQNTLYIADGPPGRIIKLAPGPDGFFDALPPLGDDQAIHVDTGSMGLHDPEGIAFNPDRSTLYVVGRDRDAVLEITTGGTLVRVIDVSFLNPRALSGVAYGPASTNPDVMNLYITDRGIDNDAMPDENDGKIYEISLFPLIATSTPSSVDTSHITSRSELQQWLMKYVEQTRYN